MEQAKKSACCSQSKTKLELVTTDPICGMTVAEDSERYFDFEAKRYLFCCDGCKTKFVENILPEYKLGPDFTGLRNIGLKVSDATKDIYYDSDGNVVDEEGKNTTKKEESVNKEENLT